MVINSNGILKSRQPNARIVQKLLWTIPVIAHFLYNLHTTIYSILKSFDPRHGSPLIWRLTFLAEICNREVNTSAILGHQLLQPRII
jgi:hypothetical protein